MFALAVMAGSANVLGAALAGGSVRVDTRAPASVGLVSGRRADDLRRRRGTGVEPGREAGSRGSGSLWPKDSSIDNARCTRPRPSLGPAPVPPVRRQPLTVEELVVDYGAVRAVDRVSVEIGPGEVVGLIGAERSREVDVRGCRHGVRSLEERNRAAGRPLVGLAASASPRQGRAVPHVPAGADTDEPGGGAVHRAGGAGSNISRPAGLPARPFRPSRAGHTDSNARQRRAPAGWSWSPLCALPRRWFSSTSLQRG